MKKNNYEKELENHRLIKSCKKSFSEKNYINILKKIKNKTIFFNDTQKEKHFTLWRHDIDYSVHRALSLAIIEKKQRVKSTYFVQLGSILYNIFEIEVKNKLLKILSLNHQIGLHFDPNKYDIKNNKDLKKYLTFEKNILERLLKIKIKVFSFHNPSKQILRYNNFRYSKMINTYAKYFIKNDVKYCSDSKGYWRFKNLENFLDEKNDKIQVLTHPEWWQKEIMSPYERIKRCVNGRSRNTIKFYTDELKKNGRKNVK